MKRRRRWFWVVGSLLFLFTLYLSNEIWNVAGVNERIRQLVVSKLRPAVGPECQIGEVRFGLSRLLLRDVYLKAEGSPVALTIPELELRYGLGSLFRANFRPERSTDRIIFRRPRLTFRKLPTDSVSQVDLSLEFTPELESRYRALVREYSFIRLIVVDDGEINLVDEAAGMELPAIREIVGLLETQPDGKAVAQLSGKLFHSPKVNAYMRAAVDFNRGGLDSMAIVIDRYSLAEGIPFLVPSYLRLDSGEVSGRLTVEESRRGNGFDVTGKLELTGGKFELGDGKVQIQDARMLLRLENGNLWVDEAAQLVNGSRVALSGSIQDIFQPRFDLRAVAPSLDLDLFLKHWAPEIDVPLQGKAQVDLRLTDAADRPSVDGEIRIPQLRLGKAAIPGLTGAIRLRDQKLYVSDIRAALADSSSRLFGSGVLKLDVPSTPIEFDLRASGEFAPTLRSLGASNLTSCSGDLRLQVGGSISHPIGEGEVQFVWTSHNGDAFPLLGRFRYEAGGVSIQATSPDRGFEIEGAIANIWDNPLLKVQATNVESTFIVLNERLLSSLREELALDVFLQGQLEKVNFLVEGFLKPSRRKFVQLYGTSQRLFSGGRRLEGEATFYPRFGKDLNVGFSAVQTEDRFDLQQVEATPYLAGSVRADLAADGALQGSLTISGLPLTELLETRYIDGKPAHRGDLYGSILFKGSTSAPQIVGNFWLLKGIYNGVGEFEAELSFELDRQGVNVPKWVMTRGGVPYLAGSLHYLFGSREIDTEVYGEDLNAQDLLQLLSGESGVYDGTATVHLRAKGQGPRVPLYGSIEVVNGHLLDLRFDQMTFRFGNDDPDGGSSSYLGEGYLRSEQITIARAGGFTLTGYGALPLVGGKELDLHFNGDGNFTPLLSDLTDLFEPSDMRAHLSLHVFGGYTSPKFSGSRLEISDGTLRLAAVAPEIKNLSGVLSISADGDFLSVENLTGTVGGRRITIRNERNPVGLNHGVQVPLRLGGDGLSVGTLLVRTDPEGIRANIPGVMAEGEYGWFELAGLDGEDFYIAGPWRRPLVRGELRLRDVDVMYPFEGDGSEPNPVVQNILYNINWNVRAVSRRDTRYVKEIPAASMYVNIKMDDEFSALDFNGVWRDSTFRIEGHLESTEGFIEYLNHVFRLEWFTADFDPSDLFPVVSGRAWTVVEDTSRVPANVYLTLYTVDDVTQQEVQRGRWEKIRVKITSDRPTYLTTQRDVLNTLGYSWDTMDQVIDKGVEVAGVTAEYQTLGRVLRPFERRLERALGLDVVHFSSRLTQNILELSRLGLLSPSLSLLRSSRLMLGKYLPGDLYFTYTGQLESGPVQQLDVPSFTYGLRHAVDLKYRLSQQIFLEMEYNYNNLYLVDKDDARVWFRWSFPLWDKK